MIIHLVFNSFFVFLTLAFFVELFLFAFKVENARVKYVCRTLPVIKLPFDLLIFSLYGESFFANFNPFSCEMYVQELLMNLLPMEMKVGISGMEHIVLPAYIVMHIPSSWLQFIILIISTVSIAMTMIKLIQFMKSFCYVNRIINTSQSCCRVITNKYLQHKLRELNVIIITSNEVQIPFAANNRYIVVPECLINEFSQEEYEAVIAHELEHLIWNDPILKLFSHFICASFWWIPTGWWLRKIEADQEQASDVGLCRYSLDPFSLATALMKVVSQTRSLNIKVAAICHLDTLKRSHITRLENMLNYRKSDHEKLFRLNAVIGTLMCFIGFISFWMC